MMRPDNHIIFFHQFSSFDSDISSARNHPSDNSHTIRKYYRTLCCRFPEFTGEYFVIQRKNKGKCNGIGGMCMINNTMSSVGKLFLYFMVHKMCRELAGRSSSLYKTPADTVIGSCLVKLNDRKTYFRVNDDITEIFTASCYQEKLSGKSRNLNTDGGPFSGGVQSWADHFHFFCFQTIA